MAGVVPYDPHQTASRNLAMAVVADAITRAGMSQLRQAGYNIASGTIQAGMRRGREALAQLTGEGNHGAVQKWQRIQEGAPPRRYGPQHTNSVRRKARGRHMSAGTMRAKLVKNNRFNRKKYGRGIIRKIKF